MILILIISAIILGTLRGFFRADTDVSPPLSTFQLRGIYKSNLGILFAHLSPILILAIITIPTRPSILEFIIIGVIFSIFSAITGAMFLRRRVLKKEARDKSKIECDRKSRGVIIKSDEKQRIKAKK